MVALSVFIMATLEIVFGRKKTYWTQKVHLAAVTFSNNTARCIPTLYIARAILAKKSTLSTICQFETIRNHLKAD